LVSAGSAGCGSSNDELPRQAVSGSVTFNGEPLGQGRIQFEPASADAKIAAGGDITGGRFSIARDQGPTPGEYRVTISSSGIQKSGTDTSPGAEPVTKRGAVRLAPPAPELIPKEYNAKTTLKAKVEGNGSNTFEFTLKK
jgi:hypothetical protein